MTIRKTAPKTVCVILLMAMFITALQPAAYAATIKIIQFKEDLSLERRSFIYVGETMDWDITTNGNPEGGSAEHGYTWSSSNNKIASVVDPGTITAKSKGEVTITAKYKDGSSGSAPLKIKQPVNSIALSKTTLTMDPSSTTSLVVGILPKSADDIDKGVIWFSSNPSIASVDSNGNITSGIQKGTATITATFTNADRFITGGNAPVKENVVGTCTVTVKKSAKSIKVSPSKVALNKQGDKKKLTKTVLPTDIENKEVKWYSSNTKVAKVDQKGNVTAVAYGNAKVYAESKENPSIKGYSTIKVKFPRTGWLYANKKTKKIKAYKKPKASSKYKKYTYGTKVKVIGQKSNGFYVVKIGKKTRYSKKVVFKQPNISIKSIKIVGIPNIKVGNSVKYKVKIVPATASHSDVKWSVDNKKYARVDKSGQVQAKEVKDQVVLKAKVSNKTAKLKICIDEYGYLRPVRYFQNPVEGAKFGHVGSRGNRAHAAIDFAKYKGGGSPVYGIIDGTIKDYYYFYSGTYALDVKNSDGTWFRYGEISVPKSVLKNKNVKKGEKLGTIKTNSGGSAMLHLEYYRGTTKGTLRHSSASPSSYKYVAKKNYQRRSDLLDPTFIFEYPTW